MKHLTIYVGENIEKLKFHSGGGEPRINMGNVYTHMVEDTFRANPYPDVHDSVFCREISKDMGYSLPNWNMHISTHRKSLINLVGKLIDEGLLSNEGVSIIMLNEDNHPIGACGFDSEGYISGPWPAGFMDESGEEWRMFK